MAQQKPISTSISVVIPAYNEEKNIIHLHRELKEALDNLNKDYEIIFVDDGSTDNTFEVLKKLHKENKNIKIIQFQKNFKKAAALSAGFKEAEGRIVITMDADLQDDPKEIPKLLARLYGGLDVVVGWKYKRKDPISKRLTSSIFNLLIRLFMKIRIHDSDCNFRVMRRETLENLQIYSGLYRYIPAILFYQGFKIGEVKVTHRPRKFGKSKYGMMRLFTGFFDLITVKFLLSYNKNPLHLFAVPGTIFTVVGFFIALYLSFSKWVLRQPIGDRPLLLLAVLLIVLGIQFISIGLLGEMILSRDEEEKYIIKKKLN